MSFSIECLCYLAYGIDEFAHLMFDIATLICQLLNYFWCFTWLFISGIAATMLRLGTTIHTRAGVPIPCENDSCSKLLLNSKKAQVIREAALIMIDEISMMNWKILNMLDRMLRSLMNKDDYMGGKCIVLMGDLRQCPPVVRRGKRAQAAADATIHGESWR